MRGTWMHRVRRAWNAVDARIRRGSVVLLYHRIAHPPEDRFGLSVREDRFEEHLDVVRRICGRPPSRLRELVDSPDPKGVAITFDDGYEDNLRCALPALERHDAPATFFVTSGCPGRAFWWDVLVAVTNEGLDRLPDVVGAERAGERGEQDHDPILRAHRILASSSPEERLRLVEIMESVGPAGGFALPRALTADEVLRLSRSPLVEIGAHTHSHPNLGRVSDEQGRQELVRNTELLREWTGQPPTSFAFPFGTYASSPSRVDRTLRDLGYERACLAEIGVVRVSTDPLRIPRFWVRDQDGDALERSLRRILG